VKFRVVVVGAFLRIILVVERPLGSQVVCDEYGFPRCGALVGFGKVRDIGIKNYQVCGTESHRLPSNCVNNVWSYVTVVGAAIDGV
jgi:hypothetical protein